MRRQGARRLTLGTGLLALVSAAGASGASADEVPPAAVAPVQVNSHREDTRAKLEHILREVDGPRVTVTKKTSVSLTDQQPAVVDDDLRTLFIRTPGVLVSGQPGLTDIRLGYRGLGTPQVLQDGLPLMDDRIGAARLDLMPPAQDLAQVQLVRGGADLIYGPGPGAAINLLTRRPRPRAPFSLTSVQVGGSDGLFSSYNAMEGTDGAWEFRASAAGATREGVQANSWAGLADGDVYVGWRPAAGQLWFVDLQERDRMAGEPGGLSPAAAGMDRSTASTPDDHDWARRSVATFGTDLDLPQAWRLEGRLQFGWLDLRSRRADGTGTAGLAEEAFHTIGLDVRARHSFGRGNALTFGLTAEEDRSPLRQWSGAGPASDPGDRGAAVLDLTQQRRSEHLALFTETVFRLPNQIHLVPSVRLEETRISVRATDPAGPVPGAVTGTAAATKQVPLLGLGIGNDFGRANETYLSVTQGYRPLQFLDITPTHGGLPSGTLADPERSLAFEAGVHGTPLRGFFYDASLFWIEVRDRREVVVSPTNPLDLVDLDTGRSRHRGFEGEVSYDWLAAGPGGQHLVGFANVSLLDATLVRSALPGLAGRTPADAPHVLLKTGLTWRQAEAFSASLTFQHIGSRHGPDSWPLTTTAPVPLPAVDLVDVSAEHRLTPHVRLLGGVRNLADRRYVLSAEPSGVRPEQGRTVYLGLAFRL